MIFHLSHLSKLALVALALVALLGDLTRVAAAPAAPTHPARRATRHHGLRLRARARLARMRLRHTRAAHGLAHLGRRLVQAQRAFTHTRVGRGFIRAKRVTGRLLLTGSARLTQGADWVEGRLPSLLGHGFHTLRALDPIALGSFVFERIKSDPVFFATYGTASLLFSNILLPAALMSAGLSPMVATAVRLAMGTPIDLLALTWRTHRRRSDPTQSFRETAVSLLHAYGEFLSARRQRNRAHLETMRSMPRRSVLHALGATL